MCCNLLDTETVPLVSDEMDDMHHDQPPAAFRPVDGQEHSDDPEAEELPDTPPEVVEAPPIPPSPSQAQPPDSSSRAFAVDDVEFSSPQHTSTPSRCGCNSLMIFDMCAVHVLIQYLTHVCCTRTDSVLDTDPPWTQCSTIWASKCWRSWEMVIAFSDA
jgi:hypothetical protein